jgi:hypothetical protein
VFLPGVGGDFVLLTVSLNDFVSFSKAYKQVDAAQQVIVDKGDVKETETHRQRHPSDKVWVKSIEEIWVTMDVAAYENMLSF